MVNGSIILPSRGCPPGYDNNRNDWANNADATRLFCRLLATPEFKDMFIDRSAFYLGDSLTAENIISLIDNRYNELKYEYQFHRNLFNPWWPNYDQEIENARKWTRNRWNFFYNHLADYFHLNDPVSLTICDNVGRKLVVNDVTLVSDSFNGKYFLGRKLSVSSLPSANVQYVIGWSVKTTNGANVQTSLYDMETLEIDIPQASSKVEISPILSNEPGAVGSILSEYDGLPEIYDLSGRYFGCAYPSSLTPGIYIIRQGSSTRRIIIK